MSGSLLPNTTRASATVPFFQPFTGSQASTITTSSITTSSITTENLTVTSGVIGLNGTTLISTIGNQLFYYNGAALEPISALSSISTIEDWAIYPAVSSINADGNDLLGVRAGFFSTLACGEGFFSTLTAVSTIQTYEILSTAVVQTDIAYAQTLSTNALAADYADIAGTVNAGLSVNVGNSVNGPLFQTTLGPAQLEVSEVNYSGIIPIPGPHYDKAVFGINNSTCVIGVQNDEVDKGAISIGPYGFQVQDNTASTVIVAVNNQINSINLTAGQYLSTGGGLYASSLSAATWNGYTPGDFLSTIIPDINISSITSASLSVSTNTLNISSAQVLCGVSTFAVSGGLGTGSLAVVNNAAIGGTLNAGSTTVNSILCSNAMISGSVGTNALSAIGPVNLSNATTIDGISSDVVIQTGPAGAQGFRVSPLGVVTTAAGYATTTTGFYQSYTSGQYIDMLAGGTLTLSHGSAFGDNAVVVKNFAGNANARMWFKNGGDISSLTTLNASNANITGTLTAGFGSIGSLGVNGLAVNVAATIPILSNSIASISSLNVSSTTANFISASGITTSSLTLSGPSTITLGTTNTAGARGQPAGRALWTGQDLDMGGNDLWAQQVKLGAGSGSGNNELQLYNAFGSVNNYWAMNWSIGDRTVRVQNVEQATGQGYMLDTIVNRPFFSTIGTNLTLQAYFPSTTASTIGISTLAVATPVDFFCSAYSSTSQTVLAANTPTPIEYNTTTVNQGGFIVSGSTITVAVAGTYEITNSIQFNTTSGGANTVDFWFRKNGADIVNSASRVSVANNAENLGTISLFDTANAGDTYAAIFESADANMAAGWFPATGTVPGIPSIITNIKRIGN